MKALEFLIWLRDVVFCVPQSTEGTGTGLPSNGELRRWLDKGVTKCNFNILNKSSVVEWPINQLSFFPKNDAKRVTIL